MEGKERGSKCQDCGNQAKKDCSYSRCRTCCKNKGFQCQTHIKSTWVPVNRSRQQRENHPSPTTHPLVDQFHQEHISKKHMHNPYNSVLVEEFKFPAAMNSTPIFRCIQVRSMDDAVNEIAYHTSVKIGGHVFSGLLYDQGPDDEGDTSTGPNLDHPQQNLSLLFNASTQTHRDDGATRALLLSASNDQPSFTPHYPFPFAPFRPGIPYFSQPRP